MHTDQIDRRRLLTRAGLVTGAALAGSVAVASPALAEGNDRGGPLLGAWIVDREDPGDILSRGVWTFVAGGVTHYQDIYQTVGGLPETTPSAPLMGAWVAGPEHTFRYEMWSPFTGFPGLPPLIARTLGTGTIDGSTIESTYLVEFYLLDGPPLGSSTGHLTGRRLTV